MGSVAWVVLIVTGAVVVTLFSIVLLPEIAGFFAAERKRFKDIERVRDEERAKADKMELRDKRLTEMAKADQFCTNCMHRASRYECSCPGKEYSESRCFDGQSEISGEVCPYCGAKAVE